MNGDKGRAAEGQRAFGRRTFPLHQSMLRAVVSRPTHVE
jgi:hypothetical protein